MKTAYIDEYGAFGFKFDKPNCSSHYIICAIIIENEQIPEVEASLEIIRQRHFQTGEMKSSKVGSNHPRRKRILDELIGLPFNVYLYVVDKRKIYENSGLRYKKSFYKYLTNQLYEELRVNFRELMIVADELGANEFKQSFYNYTRSKQIVTRNLFGDEFNESDIQLVNSKQSVINQLADLIAGSFAYCYDEQKKPLSGGYNYHRILQSKVNRIKLFPETIDSFKIGSSAASANYDPEIAETCFRKAKAYIEKNKNSDSVEVKQRVIVLEYLMFRFMNNSNRKFIPTIELINQLEYSGYGRSTVQSFRNKIIAPLRDVEVILSSSKKGYKIPSTEEELCAFINHGKTIILPMLSRLKKCNDIIANGTNGKVKLFNKAEYSELRVLLEDSDIL